jgi:hypothetical protein
MDEEAVRAIGDEMRAAKRDEASSWSCLKLEGERRLIGSVARRSRVGFRETWVSRRKWPDDSFRDRRSCINL